MVTEAESENFYHSGGQPEYAVDDSRADEFFQACLDEEVAIWFHEHRGPRTLGAILDDPDIHFPGTGFEDVDYHDAEQRERVNDRRDAVLGSVMRLTALVGRLHWVENEFDGTYEWLDCAGCGSPGPRGECEIDCDWGNCPGPTCDYRGPLSDHLDLDGTGSGPGYTGATIYWATYKCGHQDVDLSADTLEAAR